MCVKARGQLQELCFCSTVWVLGIELRFQAWWQEHAFTGWAISPLPGMLSLVSQQKRSKKKNKEALFPHTIIPLCFLLLHFFKKLSFNSFLSFTQLSVGMLCTPFPTSPGWGPPTWLPQSTVYLSAWRFTHQPSCPAMKIFRKIRVLLHREAPWRQVLYLVLQLPSSMHPRHLLLHLHSHSDTWGLLFPPALAAAVWLS